MEKILRTKISDFDTPREISSWNLDLQDLNRKETFDKMRAAIREAEQFPDVKTQMVFYPSLSLRHRMLAGCRLFKIKPQDLMRNALEAYLQKLSNEVAPPAKNPEVKKPVQKKRKSTEQILEAQ